MFGFVTCGILLILLPVLYYAVVYIMHLISLKNYPVGPFPIPVIGNLHQFGALVHETFTDWSEKYGDVYSVSFGMKRAVLINASEPAVEALVKKPKEFAGRDTDQYVASIMTNGFKDIGFCDYGEEWKLLRKLGHAFFRQTVDGKGMRDFVRREAEKLTKSLDETNGQPTALRNQLTLSVMNVMTSMMFNECHEIDDEDFKVLSQIDYNVVTVLANGDPCSFLPWLKFFPMKSIQLANEAISLKKVYYNKKIAKHEATFDPDNIKDYTDFLLNVLYNQKDQEKYGIKFTYDHFIEMLSEMIIGGTDTTANSLCWIILYLLHWPKYQEEIHREIITKIGIERKPTLDDRGSLHLLEASIQEGLRLASILPLLVPHKTTESTSVAGHPIPKDTTVFFNVWKIHRDEKYWDKPYEFNPYRWLDEDGKYSPQKHNPFFSFSAGKRSCLGEALARMEMFIFLASILREFEILPNPDEPLPSIKDYTVGLNLSCKLKKVLFKKRVS